MGTATNQFLKPARFRLTFVCLTALSLTGCGLGASSHDQSDAAPARTVVPDGVVRDDRQRFDLQKEHVNPWTRYEVVSEHQLRLHYWGGDHKCWGVRTAAEETSKAIKVATIVGSFPDAPKECRAYAYEGSVLVTTEQPIGSRRVEHFDNPPLNK